MLGVEAFGISAGWELFNDKQKARPSSSEPFDGMRRN